MLSRAEAGRVLGEGREPPHAPVRSLGSAVSSPNGVRGEAVIDIGAFPIP